MTEKPTEVLYLSNTVDALIAKRRLWEEGTYAASNTELYALLGQTLDFYLKVRGEVGLSKALNDVLDIHGVTYNSGTSTALKVVRLVFVGKGRQSKIEHRAFAYTKVLEVAAAEGATGATLPAFILERNGIDEIRRISKEGVRAADRAKHNREYAENLLSCSAGLSEINLEDTLQPADGEHFSVALVRKNPDGTGSIVFGTNNVAALRQVLTLAGAQLKKQATQEAEVTLSVQAEMQRQENLIRLAQEIQGSFTPEARINLPTVQETALA